MSARKPFSQLRYEDVPAQPRVSHPFFAAKTERVRIRTRPYGELSIRVLRYGEGPPVVCVHGFMTTCYSFRYLLEPLGKSRTVVAFDLPGSGESDAPRGSYAPDDLADAIGDVLSGLELRGAPVIGNSLGGYLCMRLALRDPRAIGRLVCLHAPGLATARMRALRIALQSIPRSNDIVRFLVRRDVERWVHKNVHYYDETLKSREEHREYAAVLRTEAGLDAFIRMLEETFDVSEMARFERALVGLRGEFPIELHLVYARKDPMVPPVVGKRLMELLPSARATWLEGASHFAHVDAPEKFLDAIRSFLRP